MSIFSQVAVQKVRHNTFNLSHDRKFSGQMGKLIPIFCAETVPNDSFRIRTNQIVRFAPLLAPVMHRFNVYTHFFFVPNRIVWDNWENFINGGYDGEQEPAFPVINLNDLSPQVWFPGSLADYLGLPVAQPNADYDGNYVSAIPFAAYQRIFWEYYRDQNVVPDDYPVPYRDSLTDGVQSPANALAYGFLETRAWQHDYFTSALPWTQRGPEAMIPLGDAAPLSSYELEYRGQGASPDVVHGSTTFDEGNHLLAGIGSATGVLEGSLAIDNAGGSGRLAASLETKNMYIPETTYADLSEATAASINDLRRAFRLQEWLELNARGGARYNETIKVHFGISPGDARLQRPEFLGGSKTPIVISEVLSTADTGAGSLVGDMAGHGVSVGGKGVVNYRCREHGYIIGIMSVMPKTAYQQGIPKHFLKFDKFDYFWRSFANIGEQPILNKELFVDGTDGLDDETFGYIPRYAEYKFINDSVHGQFRTTLDYWHAGRIFTNRPQLNTSFIQMDEEEVDRIFAVTLEGSERFYCQMYHDVKARRPMPYFGSPTL